MVIPNGQIKFGTITKSNYQSAIKDNNTLYFIYDENTEECQIAIGPNLISGESIVVETEKSAINITNSNAVAGKAVYEALQDTKDIIVCNSTNDFNTTLENGSNVGKLIYYADSINNEYKLIFKFSLTENYNLLIKVNNSYTSGSTSEDVATHNVVTQAINELVEKGAYADSTSVTTANKFYINTDSTNGDKIFFKGLSGTVYNLLEANASLLDLVNGISAVDAGIVMDNLIASEARAFLLPASADGYKKENDTVIPAETRIATLEDFKVSAETDFLSQSRYTAQTLISDLSINSNQKLLVSTINGNNDSIIKIGQLDTNTILTINHSADSAGAVFGAKVTIPTLTVSNLEVSLASYVLGGNTVEIETLETADQVKDNNITLNKRLATEGNQLLYAVDITGENGLIKKELDIINEAIANNTNAISGNTTLANSLIQIGGNAPTSTTTELWVDTTASTNGVIKYRKEIDGTVEWIAVNAVWA